MSAMLQQKSTLIVDLDNTLFDWVNLWHATFTALMREVTQQTGLELVDLEPEIRAIHQRHGTSEYAFLLSDLSALAPFRGTRPANEAFAVAISASRAARRANLRLYPTVAESLLSIKGAGCQIIAYTESLRYYSFYRLKRLGLDGVIDVLYSPHDHDVPEDVPRFYSEEYYSFRFTQHRFTPVGELKPNPDILRTILSECETHSADAVYIGDSRHKDIAMANDVGLDCAWAKYGEAQDHEAYELLKRVTHWTDDDVQREEEIRSRSVQPTIVLEKALAEIFEHFTFAERHQSKSSVVDLTA
jgi:phosphoglycolate phosphatase